MLKRWALLLLALVTLTAEAAWRSSLSDSRLEFIPSYEGTELPGRFDDFDVRMEFDPTDPKSGHLMVSVSMRSADMDDPDLNEGMAGEAFFDVARHPEARFESVAIRAGSAAGEFIAEGDLRLKGHTKRVEFPFRWRAEADCAVMEGSLTLMRLDFAVGTGEWAEADTIGNRVDVRFHVVLHAGD